MTLTLRASSAAGITLMLVACARPEKKTPPTTDSARAVAVSSAPSADTATQVRSDASATTTIRPSPPQTASANADTARGIVRRVGADPLSRLALFPTVGSVVPFALAGAQQSELAAAEGLEVMVSGTRTAERAMDVAPGGAIVFRVQRFIVRAADGIDAHDGVLVAIDGRVYLETAPGVRTPVVALPAALRDQIGARVFLVGPLTHPPQAFGILRSR